MQTLKRFITLLLCALLSAPVALARDLPRDAGQSVIVQDVVIIIGQEQVRFTSQKAVQEMRLQIVDQAGDVVYDSGISAGPEINWPLQRGDGQSLTSGLYAYTLSIREQGAEAAQVRRGHFIVDRAKDRDGADKLWITSQGAGGVGTELTVARDEAATVAGATVNAERAPEHRTERLSRESGDRGVETEAREPHAKVNPTAAAAIAGTAGQIARFTSATDLGNSIISEVNGNIGIGTTAPLFRMTVQTPTNNFGIAHTDGTISVGTWVGTKGAWFGTRTAHNLNFFTANGSPRMTINTAGNVGIGTENPEFPLHVNGNSGIASSGSGGGFFFRNRETSTPNVSTDYWGWYTSGNIARLWQSGAGDLLTVTPRGVVNYGQLAKLDVAANTHAYVRAHDLLIGHPSRRGEPGRALVDGGAYGLYINFAGDWAATTIGSNLAVVGSDLLIGHPSRRGAPGRAFVDGGTNGLFINFAKDWARTVIESDLTVRGRTTTNVLEIVGGADFSENFDISSLPAEGEAKGADVQPGMVVSIDPAAPGRLMLSARAYDYQVAGIVSGAGGVKPGMILSQEGTLANGKHPVALSGRVYCWVDASNGPIKPGDLLTTSATPGHAMKATDRERAQGAIIGKAMTGLKEGKGLVLVLVTLQ